MKFFLHQLKLIEIATLRARDRWQENLLSQRRGLLQSIGLGGMQLVLMLLPPNAMSLAGNPLSCSTIYGITSDATNTLLKTFDPTTGTVASVTTMGAAVSAFTLGIDPVSGRAYYVANTGAAQYHIFAYDPISGVTTDTGTVVPIQSGLAALQLGFDKTGVGYVVDQNFNAWSFTTTSSVVTSLGVVGGMSGYNGGDIAFESNNDYWTVSRNTTNGNYTLFRVTRSGNTLTATKIGDLQEGGVTVTNAANIGSIAFDPAGNLYIIRSSDGHSWKIDPKTAKATTIANSIANNGNGISDFATCATPTTALSISGNVFEDVNYGGGAGRSITAATGVVRPNARVELYDPTGAFKGFTTTNAAGVYTFDSTNIPGGILAGNYSVRVVNSTVTSSRPGAVNTLLPVQTFRTDASSATVVAKTDRVGGEKPSEVDAPANSGSQTLATLNGVTGQEVESIAPVTISGVSIAGIDFGYNFDTIVNTNDSGQGSLRQFITNSNALTNSGLAQVGLTAGTETSIFMIPDGSAHPGILATVPSQLTSGVARIIPTSALPAITDSNTAIDGTTQTANIGDTNSGQVGTGGKVGTGADGRENTGDEPTLDRVNKPEVEIKGNNTIAIGLDLKGNNETVRGLAIYGYGSNPGAIDSDIIARGTGELIQANLLGSAAANFADPGAGNRTEGGSHVYLDRGSNTTITNNIIAFGFRRGILSSETGVVNFTITDNEIRDNNREDSYQGGGIEFVSFGSAATNSISPQGIISGNSIANNSPTGQPGKDLGIELGGITNGTMTIRDNTITGNSNGIGGYSIKYPNPHTNNITITHNSIHNNFGAGINIGSLRGLRFIQNSIYANVGLGIQLGAGANDGVYNTNVTNSSSDPTSPGNDAIDYPIVNVASLTGGTLNVSGFIGNTASGTNKFANATIEFFIADNSPADQNMQVVAGDGLSVAHGEGRTYIGTCTATANSLFNCSFPNAGSLGLTNPTNITATTTLTASDGSIISSQFGAVRIKANVLLVKRITAINGDRTKNPNDNTPLNTFVDNTTTTTDNDPNWPSNYLLGESTAGKVKPGDEIEYTIYYLNQGDNPAKFVKICDLLAPNLVFNPSGFSSGIGFQLKLGSSPAQSLTSANDPTIDRARYINAPFVSLTGCNSPTNNTNASGAVVLDLNSTSATDPSIPTNLLTIPSATSSSPMPNNSYGLLRFKAKVK